jgi:hypothetical protein
LFFRDAGIKFECASRDQNAVNTLRPRAAITELSSIPINTRIIAMTTRRRNFPFVAGWNQPNIALVAATLMLTFCVVSVTFQVSFHVSFRKHEPLSVQKDTTGDALLGLGSPPRHNLEDDHQMKAAISTATAKSQQTSLEANNDSYIAGDPAVEAITAKPDAASSLKVFYNMHLPVDQDDDAIDKAISKSDTSRRSSAPLPGTPTH